MANLCIHIPNCIWTKALLDGWVKVDGYDVSFEPAVFDPRGSSRLRGDVEDKYAATEQVIPDFFCASPAALNRSLWRCRFSLPGAWYSASSSCGVIPRRRKT